MARLKNEDFRFLIAFLVAVGADLADYFNPVFLAPIIGDPLDIATIALIFALMRDWRVGISLLELAPFGDVLPFYTFVSLWVISRKKLKDATPKLVPEIKKTNKYQMLFIMLGLLAIVTMVLYALPDTSTFSLLP